MLETRANKNIRKNDMVTVISGKNKGKSGKVLKVDPGSHSVIIEKVNFVKKHQRGGTTKYRQGGIIEREGAVKLDVVMLMCPKCSKPTRIKIDFAKDGAKQRFCKKCNELIEVKK